MEIMQKIYLSLNFPVLGFQLSFCHLHVCYLYRNFQNNNWWRHKLGRI